MALGNNAIFLSGSMSQFLPHGFSLSPVTITWCIATDEDGCIAVKTFGNKYFKTSTDNNLMPFACLKIKLLL